VEGSWRAHQVPVLDVQANPEHLRIVEQWMRGYRPEELFDAHGTLVPELRALPPTGDRRMSANPHTNGGNLRKALSLPDFREYAVPVDHPGAQEISPTETLGKFLRDVMRRNMTSFRLFSPDENASNRLQDVYEASKKTWMAEIRPEDADGTDIAGRAGDGDAQRAHPRRLVEGYLLARPRVVPVRGLRPHHHSMYNQHGGSRSRSRAHLATSHLLVELRFRRWSGDRITTVSRIRSAFDLVSNKAPM
jgi:xylulose-5-phosphate/fructose-6-phosphate phosphoketolase